MAKSSPLADQIVLVTGASRGLGWAILKAFIGNGARVVLNYRSTPADQLHNTISSEYRDDEDTRSRIFPCQGDITDPAQCRAIFSAAEQHFGSPITTVVNNAMAGKFKFNGDARPKIHELEWEQIDTQLQGFLRGTLNTTKAALPGFEGTGFGRIVNIGTNLLSNPVVPYHDYVAAKGSLLAFTRTSAAELGEKNVTVNMVSGGLLRVTEASESTPDDVFKLIEGVTPLKRVITPEEVADVVLFFASPWSRAVTGQDIQVDGGLVMR
ncbi:uncharacterized protein HMPREF1541_07572 [Cyphellophora europaea CBS 101466]|uniref:3-oxoacyl-[acyl-carrier protein] reductase n=1 Tax=Cyphellophora europaea (strain CBS 101466) TaxID=1220924 RepID=W2RQF9_CYPE1|nr:uncharacterized protein HMPREF1541_07572 [Cyphellophora europaea CBS 101466]ETN37949.1 hypothetical protein HMPREF1541_07572 [Cyphellophora europaea CBS 101466]